MTDQECEAVATLLELQRGGFMGGSGQSRKSVITETRSVRSEESPSSIPGLPFPPVPTSSRGSFNIEPTQNRPKDVPISM